MLGIAVKQATISDAFSDDSEFGVHLWRFSIRVSFEQKKNVNDGYSTRNARMLKLFNISFPFCF